MQMSLRDFSLRFSFYKISCKEEHFVYTISCRKSRYKFFLRKLMDTKTSAILQVLHVEIFNQ